MTSMAHCQKHDYYYPHMFSCRYCDKDDKDAEMARLRADLAEAQRSVDNAVRSDQHTRGVLRIAERDYLRRIDALNVDLAAARADAARYRWLRNQMWMQAQTQIYVLPTFWSLDDYENAGDSMDAAIDAELNDAL